MHVKSPPPSSDLNFSFEQVDYFLAVAEKHHCLFLQHFSIGAERILGSL